MQGLTTSGRSKAQAMQTSVTSDWTRIIVPDSQSRLGLVETIIISLMVVVMGWLVSPNDPLMMKEPFPWVWFGPVLIALRYGVLMGVLSALILVGNAIFFVFTSHHGTDLPLAYFLGGLLLTLIVGEFSGVWYDRNKRKEEANLYLEERLTRLTRRYLLMKLSHDRLEQEMLARPGSLRSAIHDLRQQELNVADSRSDLPAGQALLGILSQYCLVEEAALYAARTLESGEIKLSLPVSMLGKPPMLSAQDKLLEHAVKHKVLAHIGESTNDSYNSQLIVAPLYETSTGLVGVLAVRSMPFFALNDENLQLMQVILSYYTDTATNAEMTNAVMRSLPRPTDTVFAEEMARLLRVAMRTGVGSQIMIMRFTGEKKQVLPDQIHQLKRGLDVMWVTQLVKEPALFVLMPFGTQAGVQGFKVRMESWLKERHNATFDSLKIDVYELPLARVSDIERLGSIVSGRL
jgi:hypothetical protein